MHLTFVRSVDLDEWTQRQIDAMRIGGNENAKKFFKKQGVTNFNDKVRVLLSCCCCCCCDGGDEFVCDCLFTSCAQNFVSFVWSCEEKIHE